MMSFVAEYIILFLIPCSCTVLSFFAGIIILVLFIFNIIMIILIIIFTCTHTYRKVTRK